MGCNLQKLEICVRRGATIALPIRIESSVLGYRAITAVAKSAPVRITSVAHGLKDGWRALVVNVGGMTQLNAETWPPRDRDFRPVNVIDDDTIEFNAINAAAFSAYTSGGQIVFYEPLNLSAYASARMEVKDKVGGSALAFFSTADGTIELDAANDTLWLKVSNADSAAWTFARGVFDIELVRTGGAVDPVCAADSVFTVSPETTTSE